MKYQNIILIVVVFAIAGSILVIESRKVDTDSGAIADATIAVDTTADVEEIVAQKSALYERAKEITTPDGFINVDDITVEENIGKNIILVDFWTYSCINCQRTLPYLNDWHDKYGDKGLVILGIHTPEFEFEKEYENVLRAVEKYNIEYPVILDNDYSTWRSYKNRYWPRKYIIDIDGFIVYDHIGEGGYEETEAKIVELLNERNRRLGEEEVEMVMEGPDNVDEVDFSRVASPESYLGSDRIEHIGNLPEQSCLGGVCTYTPTEDYQLNKFQLGGTWDMGPESSVLTSESGSIFYRFNANKVNLVADGGRGVSAEIYLDGELVLPSHAGYSVENGVVEFTDSDLYNLINLRGAYGEHLLEIRFLEPGVETFAFTFG